MLAARPPARFSSLPSPESVNQKPEPSGNTLLAQRYPLSGNSYFWRTAWEGSPATAGSKLMSRRTERPYKVDGAGEHAPQGAARCSAPEINGPVVPQEFTFLLRETCKGAPLETVGAVVSNGHRALAGVSRGRSTESNEPDNTGGPHNSGRAELGRQNTTIGGLDPGALKPIG